MITTPIVSSCYRSGQGTTADLAKIARGALQITDIGVLVGMPRGTISRAMQDQWLATLAKQVIRLAKSTPQSREFYDEMYERLRAQGYQRLDVEDIVVLAIRLARAGYIPMREV